MPSQRTGPVVGRVLINLGDLLGHRAAPLISTRNEEISLREKVEFTMKPLFVADRFNHIDTQKNEYIHFMVIIKKLKNPVRIIRLTSCHTRRGVF